jgi:hypothetical protein
MAFPTTGILDSFTDTNGVTLPSHSANWYTFANGHKISANTAIPNSTTEQVYYSRWEAAGFGADEEAYFTITEKGLDGTDSQGCAVRWNTVGLYEVAIIYNSAGDTIELGRETDPTVDYTALESYAQEITVGDKVGISAVGNIITIWYCPVSTGIWSAKGTHDISSETPKYTAAGKIGIVGYNKSTAGYDDFGGGTVVSASTVKGFMTTNRGWWGP